MSEKIHVERVSPFETAEWRAVRSNGDLLFEIRVQISARLNGSRYFVIGSQGEVVRHGSFHFDAWDHSAIAEVLTAIVTTVVPGAEVEVEIRPPQQVSGA
jgi:hypothetical protein